MPKVRADYISPTESRSYATYADLKKCDWSSAILCRTFIINYSRYESSFYAFCNLKPIFIIAFIEAVFFFCLSCLKIQFFQHFYFELVFFSVDNS